MEITNEDEYQLALSRMRYINENGANEDSELWMEFEDLAIKAKKYKIKKRDGFFTYAINHGSVNEVIIKAHSKPEAVKMFNELGYIVVSRQVTRTGTSLNW